MDLEVHTDKFRGRALTWLTPHFIELVFGPSEAERRAYVCFVAYSDQVEKDDDGDWHQRNDYNAPAAGCQQG